MPVTLTAGYAYACPMPNPVGVWPYTPAQPEPTPVFIPWPVVLPEPVTIPDRGAVEEARAKLKRLEDRRAVLASELSLVDSEIATLKRMLAAVESAP